MLKEVKNIEYIKWFSELSNKDIAIAGGKGASLAEMFNSGFPIPPGFVVSAQAYDYFIKSSKIGEKIMNILSKLNVENTYVLESASREIRSTIEQANLPIDLEKEILEAYEILGARKQETHEIKQSALDILKSSHEPPFVAVRSSATTEDLANASFAGQQDSFLGIKGNHQLIDVIKKCFSSLFTARAIYYRQKKGFSHEKAYLAIVIQKMINSQKSGVMFSQNPLKNDNTIVIEAVWGLGEGIVSGKIVPDHYVCDRELNVIEMKINEKKIAMIRTSSGKIETVNLVPEKSIQQVLTGYEIKKLANYGIQLEEHYGKPQDIEFAIDGEIYIVQSRPITTKVLDNSQEVSGDVLLSGLGASPGISSGQVKIVHSLEELGKVHKGDILVTMMTNPDMVVTMQRAAGIVTDEGGITSHAAIISREMGIPCVVGTRTATKTLKEGQLVTVDGFTGRVFNGKAQEKKVEINPIVKTKTKIKVIIDLPDYAQRAALTQALDVGLVRLEGIISISGKHPVWYIKNNKIKDYISLLATGLKKIALPFKEIWIRTSDIRTDEYVHLEGAPREKESNPMLGNHGIRFHIKNIDLLEAELMAIKEIADEFSNKIFGIMMPQIISVDEIKKVKKISSELKMPENIKIGIMVETPAAVQIIDEICQEGIKFISFGTNDLTQYTLAIDRNNSEVQDLYDEMHPAVLNSIKQVIQVCKKYNVETSICGQAGSREDMVRFLVQEGIGSISCNADAAHKVSLLVSKLESQHHNNKENSIDYKENSKQKNEQTHLIESIEDTDKINNLDIKEEDLILNALDDNDIIDEYNPNIQKKDEVPSLNDVIPLESEDFNKKKEDKFLDIF